MKFCTKDCPEDNFHRLFLMPLLWVPLGARTPKGRQSRRLAARVSLAHFGHLSFRPSDIRHPRCRSFSNSTVLKAALDIVQLGSVGHLASLASIEGVSAGNTKRRKPWRKSSCSPSLGLTGASRGRGSGSGQRCRLRYDQAARFQQKIKQLEALLTSSLIADVAAKK